MTKATHNGTCQRCGNKHAIKNGVLVNHGYTVDNGWFQGICSGTGSAPLEVDKTLATSTVEWCNDEADRLYAVTADKVTHVPVRTGHNPYTYKTVSMAINEYAELYETLDWATKRRHGNLETLVENVVYTTHRHAKGLLDHGKMIAKLIENTFGNPLESREAIKPLRERFEFNSYREADVKAKELKLAGYKTRIAGIKSEGFVLTATMMVA